MNLRTPFIRGQSRLFGLRKLFMSFTFNWPRFSDQFHYDAVLMLNNALNKGNKPPVIADTIEVVELEMGTEVHADLRSLAFFLHPV